MATEKHFYGLDSRVNVLRHKRDGYLQCRVFHGRDSWGPRRIGLSWTSLRVLTKLAACHRPRYVTIALGMAT